MKQFFALVRAGLWEKRIRLLPLSDMEFNDLYNLAEEQSVVGLVTAGLEGAIDKNVSQDLMLQFIGTTLQLEQDNKAMNSFIANLISGMNKFGISVALIKGQGVAQCYERPLWRSAGDIDLFLDAENFCTAKAYFKTLSAQFVEEDRRRLHIGMIFEGWNVELHGTMHTAISRKMDSVIDNIQNDLFYNRGTRIWNNEGVAVVLPNPDNDIILIFTHFLKHFYVGGIGLRQICDWCRLLWVYGSDIDRKLLELRLKEAKIMAEWKGFAVFAVDYLGMEKEAMPFYVDTLKMHRKANKKCMLIMQSGNLGHNKDISYRDRYSRIVSFLITFGIRIREFSRIVLIFPWATPRVLVTYVYGRIRENIKYLK